VMGAQTGGSKRQWLYDTSRLDESPVIRDALVHYDEYFVEDHGESTLAIILDRLLAALPEECEEALRLLHLAGLSQRAAARVIGCDHKTVKSRAKRGIEILRSRMGDEAWLSSMLQGLIPDGEVEEGKLGAVPLQDFIKSLEDK
jgi:DNA-directed RNA polymerase specialized sigma24 family protein